MIGIHENKTHVEKGLKKKSFLGIRRELEKTRMGNRRQRKVFNRRHLHEDDEGRDDLFED